MFGTHWSTFVDARVQKKSDSAIFANSRANNSDRSAPIKSIIEFIRDLSHIHFDQVWCSLFNIWRC